MFVIICSNLTRATRLDSPQKDCVVLRLGQSVAGPAACRCFEMLLGGETYGSCDSIFDLMMTKNNDCSKEDIFFQVPVTNVTEEGEV